jgi:hypothetical protein
MCAIDCPGQDAAARTTKINLRIGCRLTNSRPNSFSSFFFCSFSGRNAGGEGPEPGWINYSHSFTRARAEKVARSRASPSSHSTTCDQSYFLLASIASTPAPAARAHPFINQSLFFVFGGRRNSRCTFARLIVFCRVLKTLVRLVSRCFASRSYTRV